MASQDTVTLVGEGPVTPDTVTPDTATASLATPPPSTDLRKRLREATQQPKERKKRAKKSKDEKDIAAVVDPLIRKLDRKTRWMTLLTASNAEFASVIKEVYGSTVTADSFEWSTARQKIFDSVKSYKYRVLENVERHVRVIKIMEKEKKTLFADLTQPSHLHKVFVSMFSKESFFSVFYYMEGYLDVDGSSELGLYYLKNLYANLCVRAKLLVDYTEMHPDSKCLDERQKLSDFYKRMTNKKEFDEVDKSCFMERFDKSMREKAHKKFVPNLLADDDPDFILSAPPPAKDKDVVAAADGIF